jgi:hypothetical protein
MTLQWDGNGDGYVEQARAANVDVFRQVWVRLCRTGDQVSGSYSYDGVNFAPVGRTTDGESPGQSSGALSVCSPASWIRPA